MLDDSCDSITFGYGDFQFNRQTGDVVFKLSPTDDYVKVIRQIGTLLFPIIDHSVKSGGLPVHAGVLEQEAGALSSPLRVIPASRPAAGG